MVRLPNANRWGTVQMPFPVPVDRSILTTMQPHRGFFMPVSGCMRPGRAFFIPKIARHGVKLHSQGGCDPRKQSAGGKEPL